MTLLSVSYDEREPMFRPSLLIAETRRRQRHEGLPWARLSLSRSSLLVDCQGRWITCLSINSRTVMSAWRELGREPSFDAVVSVLKLTSHAVRDGRWR